MFKLSNISFENSGSLNPLVLDYIKQTEKLKPFYNHFPDKTGFDSLLKSNPYSKLDREILTLTLLEQSELVLNTGEQTRKNISHLKNKNTFTITTGHQLCLFSGPLYFIYKLFSVINLAEELNAIFPEYHFVPVYWMATEDHDFEEVNHFNLFNKKISWLTEQKGAVGNFKTNELSNCLNEFKEIIGDQTHSQFLIDLFEKSYLKHENLKDATRYFVNELFGNYGLITVDGDDQTFKHQAKDIFRNDIFENTAQPLVNKSIEQLNALNYKQQVNPREINCFYIEEGLRGRIEKQGDKYHVIGTEIYFTESELEKLIINSPEKISPNVVLRPLYQQQILPNVAYVGGPGELAYWLQYKLLFDEFKILFPVLTPRSFVTIIDKNILSKINKLGFNIEDAFKDEQELINKFQEKNSLVFDLDNEQKTISEIFASIGIKISHIDKTLINSVSAEEQKTIKGLETLIQKANRALKQKSETEINQIKQIKNKLFPEGTPQERHDNFSAYYSVYGIELLNFIKNNISTLSFSRNIITEE